MASATQNPVEENGSQGTVSKEDQDMEDLFNGEVETLSAVKYQDILQKQVAFFSGACHEGCPILCFPSSGLRHLVDDKGWEDFDTTITYMKSLLTPEQLSKGLVMLVDGRKGGQIQVTKTILEKIADKDFPLKCNTLFLFKLSHMSQLTNISSITSYFSKQKTKITTPEIKETLNVISVRDKDELFLHIPSELLTEDFGGSLLYDHQQWIQNAVLYEKVQHLRERILFKFPDVRDGLNEFEIPQSVKDAERLMQQHLKLKEFFINFFAEIDVLIDDLTNNLLKQSSETTHSVAAAVATLPSTEVLLYLNKTNQEVHEEQAEFDKFWAIHKQRLDHMMRACHYKRSVEKVRHLMQGHIDDLTHYELTIGEGLEASLELGEKHENFVSTCKEKMDAHLNEIREESATLLKIPTGDDTTKKILTKAVEGIKESVQSLTEQYQELMRLCQQKRDLFIVAVKFHMTIRQCEQWCASVKEFTEIHPSVETTSSDRARDLVRQTDTLMKQMTQRSLNTLKEFSLCLPEKDVKKPVSKTFHRCKTSRDKLEEYRNKLLQIVALSYAPPTPPKVGKHDLSSSPGNSISSLTPDSMSHDLSLVNSTSSSERSDKPDGLEFLSYAGYIDDESDPAMLRKREFVYKEIVDTEKDYISNLQIILDSYYYEMYPEERVPLRLRGKRGIVFGNLEQIYKFHNDLFLKQLELYNEHPERIGTCFIQHSSEFQLYSSYCRNRPNSEALLVESPECKSFFKEIQIRLAHQLPLISYLIKPIQRITKYQLLLKDMIKYSSKSGQALTDLQTALSMMLQVLKNLNDSLHVVGLKGFPGALAEQGRLLVHDPFQVWEGAAHSRGILSRSHERHVFLFEKVLVFSKKKDDSNQQKKDNKSDSYHYKAHVHLADVQLKEHVDSNPLSFGVSLHGRNKMFQLQAANKDIREMWVLELRRLLSNQFGLLRDVVLQSGTLDRAAAEKFAKMQRSSRGKTKLFQDAVPEKDDTYLEQKKSFSDRFKLSILPKKKLTSTISSEFRNSNSTSPPITSSLGPRKALKVLDDQVLTTSVPSNGLNVLKVRTKSQNDVLDGLDDDNTNNEEDDDEWSDDDDEYISPVTSVNDHDHYESLAPGVPCFYTATADYNPSDEDHGIPLKRGQEVELIGINQYSGWWWVRLTNFYTHQYVEGWVPASYLQISSIE